MQNEVNLNKAGVNVEAESYRLRNAFKRNYLIPTIGIFIDVQAEASRCAMEEPEKYKLDCAKDQELETKFYTNYSKVTVGDSRPKAVQGDTEIHHPRIADVKRFVLTGDLFGSFVQFNCDEKVDLFVRKPRGIAYTIKGVIPGDSQHELQNVYNIYGGESSSIAIRYEDAWVAIKPEMTEGKAGKSVKLWFWSKETGVLVDDARKYFDCTPVLRLFRG